ncbi:MAG: hypothetical protein ACOVLB_07905 [Candidatus Nanopelagicus sp.]
MALPLVSKTDILSELFLTIPKSIPRVEISGIFPSDDGIIPYGLYVDDVTTDDKSPVSLGVQYSGSIYVCSDVFTVIFVSFQDDEKSPAIQNAIQNLSSNLVLMNGYHEMDFARTVVIGNKSEKHTYRFTLKRLEFLN